MTDGMVACPLLGGSGYARHRTRIRVRQAAAGRPATTPPRAAPPWRRRTRVRAGTRAGRAGTRRRRACPAARRPAPAPAPRLSSPPRLPSALLPPPASLRRHPLRTPGARSREAEALSTRVTAFEPTVTPKYGARLPADRQHKRGKRRDSNGAAWGSGRTAGRPDGPGARPQQRAPQQRRRGRVAQQVRAQHAQHGRALLVAHRVEQRLDLVRPVHACRAASRVSGHRSTRLGGGAVPGAHRSRHARQHL